MLPLSKVIKLKRRYTRSINLERDLQIVDSVLGYVLTSKAREMLDRFINAYFTPNTIRSWTITGVYGTGKSSFAHFLTALCGAKDSLIKKNALKVLEESSYPKSKYKNFKTNFSGIDLLRAVATATYEPLSNTIVRALHKGISLLEDGKIIKLESELENLFEKVNQGINIDNKTALNLLKKVADLSENGVLLIIDELGKNFEFSANNHTVGDLYLLQEIAELPSQHSSSKIFIIGILHKSFADYYNGLTRLQKDEWVKVQARFENISFKETDEQIIELIGNALEMSEDCNLNSFINNWSESWKNTFMNKIKLNGFTPRYIKTIYPLHPLTAIVISTLCSKYAQNDRTLFTFLTEKEPHSLATFLKEHTIENNKLPTLKLPELYDYFTESAGIVTSFRSQYQKWAEIYGRIQDAKGLEPDFIKTLKAIGLLNLITSSGYLKASKKLIPLALCDCADDEKGIAYWEQIIQKLIELQFITWIKQIDELRIWEGSDFDIESELEKEKAIKISLASLLDKFNPLKPVIAHRHSYKTGTLRYFEKHYIDNNVKLNEITCKNKDSDGVICYWIDNKDLLKDIPKNTSDGKPLIIIRPENIEPLDSACREYSALREIDSKSTQLQRDGIARREVRYRIGIAKKYLDDILFKTFTIEKNNVNVWICGEEVFFDKEIDELLFNVKLSELCSSIYEKGLILWNELINRRQISTQASKARRELITAMINNTDKERFGISGYGPEISIYESLLGKTGIHRKNGDVWEIQEPYKTSGVLNVWNAMKDFCMKEAINAPKTLDLLYEKLKNIPYGVKDGPIPILLAAILIKYSDELSLYRDGTFIHIFDSGHFELLIKNPSRYAVKHIYLKGLRWQLLKDLESLLCKPGVKSNQLTRNETVLNIVKPLINFAMNLLDYTKNTKSVSKEAISLREALLSAKEPDILLFMEIPKALGMPPINDNLEEEKVKSFKETLVKTLQELNKAYEKLLFSDCRKLLCKAFGIEDKELRKELCEKAIFLKEKCVEPQLKSFIGATIEKGQDEKRWLEALVFVIRDKQPYSWNDDDIVIFENNLGHLSNKFLNIEALQKDRYVSNRKNVEARKITITRPNRPEINKIVYIEDKYMEKINSLIENLSTQIGDNKELQQAFVALLSERFLDTITKGEK